MRRRWLAAVGVLILVAGCGPTLTDELRRTRYECEQAPGPALQRAQGCQQQQRAQFAAYGETPTRWHESIWAFRLVVAQKGRRGRDHARGGAVGGILEKLDYLAPVVSAVHRLVGF